MRYNGNKFSVYESEEKTVLGLLDELGSQVNHNTEDLENKTDLFGDHKGSWQGLNRPTLSEEGMRAAVEDIIDNKIPSIETSLDNIVKNIEDFGAIGDNKTDNTLAFQKALNSEYNKFLLSENSFYKLGQVTIPAGKEVVFYGKNCGIIALNNANPLFRKTDDTSKFSLSGIMVGGIKQQFLTDCKMVETQSTGKYVVYGTKDGGTLIDIANFAGQGYSSNFPIGLILHSYTDGRPIQIDNVGSAPSIVALKNAYNPTRRPDKPEDFVGNSGYVDFLFHRLSDNTEQRLFGVKSNADCWWTTEKTTPVNFSTGKADDSNFAWEFQCLQRNTNVFTLKNVLDNVLNFINDVSGTRMKITAPSNLTNGLRIESLGGEVVIASKAGTMIDMQNALRMKPIQQSSIPQNEKNILFLDGTSGKLCFKDINGSINELY